MSALLGRGKDKVTFRLPEVRKENNDPALGLSV